MDKSEKIFDNLSDSEKENVRKSFGNFQGVESQYESIIQDKIKAYSKLNVSQIAEILSGAVLKIGKEITCNPRLLKRELIIDKDFIEDCFEIENFNSLGINRYGGYDLDDVIFVSDLPKSGRTTILKQFLSENKDKKSFKAYVDLRDFKEVEFKNFEDVLMAFCENEFEKFLYLNVYSSSNVVWDNIEELSKEKKNILLSLLWENKNDFRLGTISPHRHWIVTEPMFCSDYWKYYPQQKCEINRKCCQYELYLKFKIAELIDTRKTVKNGDVSMDDFIRKVLVKNKFRINVSKFLENLEKVSFFITDHFDFQFYDVVAKFAFSIEFNSNFETLTDFFTKLINWSLNQLSGIEKSTQNEQEKSLQNFEIRNLIESDSNLISECEVNFDEFLKFSPLPEDLILHRDPYLNYSRFIDKSLEEFFIAKFLIRNIFEIKIHSSEEASFLITLLIQKSKNKYFNKFFCELINEKPIEERKASTAIHQTIELRTFFKKSKNFDISFSEYFVDDKDALKALFNLDENETFLLWWKREHFQWTNCDYEVKIKKLFNKSEIKRMKLGKHQTGNFLYLSWKKMCTKTQNFVSMAEYDEKNKIKNLKSNLVNMSKQFQELYAQMYENNWNFFEFFAFIETRLSREEIREVIKSNSHEIFRHFVKNLEQFEMIWIKIENLMEFNEINELLKPHHYRLVCIYHNSFQQKDSQLLKAYFDKFDKYLSEKSIKHYLVNELAPFGIAAISKSKDILQTFLEYSQKHQIELKSLLFAKATLPYDDNRIGYFTAIEHAAIAGDLSYFDFVLDLYQKNLTNEELKKIIGNQSGVFLYVLITISTVEICEKIAKIIDDLYGQQESFTFFDSSYMDNDFLFYYFSNKNIYCNKLEPFMSIIKKYENKYWIERSEFINERNDLS